jgi:hypothetical protein
VTVADIRIDWNERELEDLLNSPEGPVGELLEDLAQRAALAAKAAAPVQKPSSFSYGKKGSSSYMPWSGGYTKAKIRPVMGFTKGGKLFSGVNSPFGPTLFLEHPARQLHHPYPFMTTGLYSVSL